jgi:hypothetical protein
VRVRRQIRRIELWPLAKVSLVFHLVSFGTTLAAGVILYHLGNRSGVIDRFTSFLGEIGFAQDFAVDGDALLRAAVPAGLALVLLATVVTVLAGALYNVVSGLLGGLVISVIEDRNPITRSAPIVANESPAADHPRRSRREGRSESSPRPDTAASVASTAASPSRGRPRRTRQRTPQAAAPAVTEETVSILRPADSPAHRAPAAPAHVLTQVSSADGDEEPLDDSPWAATIAPRRSGTASAPVEEESGDWFDQSVR